MSESETFLLIDDDRTLTSILKRALQRQGHQALEAWDQASALAQCQEHEVQKCVLDLKLDTESGLILLPKLLEIRPFLEVVVLTGYSSISTAVEAIKLGATNYLCKPADAQEILAAFADRSGNPGTEIVVTPPSIERLEWEHIQKVLQDHNGNISATARALGMHRRTLQRKLQKRPVKK